MIRANRLSLWLLPFLAVTGCLSVRAAEEGKLQLLDLPERRDIFVYVDGKPVPAEAGKVTLPSGWHELQVEEPQSGRVFRRMVEMQPRRSRSLRVDLRYVVPLGPMRFRQAPTGPPGPPGPRGRAANPLALETEPNALAGVLQQALSSLVADLEGRKEDLHTTLRERAGTPVPDCYYYAPPKNNTPPPGPRGARGPRGPAGMPGDALLLQTQAGKPLLEEVKRRLNLTSLEGGLLAVEPRIAQLPSRGPNDPGFIPPARRVAIRTPQWKAQLDRAIEQQKQEYARYLQEPGSKDLGLVSPGRRGFPGRRGEDGIVPAEVQPVRLTRDQVEQVIALLIQDEVLRQRMRRLNAEVDDLALWTTEAEQQIARSKAPVYD